jgi:diguanylate cyclase (GGDEF)-like protein
MALPDLPSEAAKAGGAADQPDRIGCSKLCYVLAGIGLSLSTTAGLFTYSLLHEQQEALGGAVVDHIASSKCTAINSSLAALAVARSDVLNGEPEGERTQLDWIGAVGVVNTRSWALEDFHTAGISAAQAVTSLRNLPRHSLESPTSRPIQAALDQASPALLQELRTHGCSTGYGLSPEAVHIVSIPQPGAENSSSTGASGHGSWFALLYGPWTHDGQQKTAFALVDLNAATLGVSGHDRHGHGLEDLFHGNSGRLTTTLDLSPASVLSDQLTLHRAMPGLDAEDNKLLGLRIIPFANQILRAELSVDHQRLDRGARRSAALVFLMGLLATSSVVVISRRTELKLRRLNLALLHESRTDGLTRLANRRAWDETLLREESRRQRHGHRYGLVVVDLNGFKRINDEQGHHMGDRVLQTAASQMAAVLRESDLLARVGGDEFAVLSINPTSEGLQGLTQRLSQALEDAGIKASLGSALSQHQTTLEQTWAEADSAMYSCKSGMDASAPARSGEAPIPDSRSDCR